MKHLRFAFPGWFGRRHAGLGNELFPLAKAFLASQELGAHLLSTSWSLNDRRYSRFFSSSRADWIPPATLSAALPTFELTESDYIRIGREDYGDALRIFAEERDLFSRRAFAFKATGLWGEFAAIRRARSFILQYLGSARCTQPQIYELVKRIGDDAVSVAVNVRLGDFTSLHAGQNARGLWNFRLPLEWYSKVCRSIAQQINVPIKFYLVTDGSPNELKAFIDEFGPVTEFDLPNKDVASLLVMAQADLLICSVSSYSEWAAFLGTMPYIWYEDHLREVDGRFTIWGKTNALPRDGEMGRGTAVGADGTVPGWVVQNVEARWRQALPGCDLVQGGGVGKTT